MGALIVEGLVPYNSTNPSAMDTAIKVPPRDDALEAPDELLLWPPTSSWPPPNTADPAMAADADPVLAADPV